MSANRTPVNEMPPLRSASLDCQRAFPELLHALDTGDLARAKAIRNELYRRWGWRVLPPGCWPDAPGTHREGIMKGNSPPSWNASAPTQTPSSPRALVSAPRPRDDSAVCPGCGSPAPVTRPGKGPHAAGLWCPACERHVRWLRVPVDAAVAAEFVMPFGKHRGRTLGQIARLDPGYLNWLANAFRDGKIGQRAGRLLEPGCEVGR